MVTLGKMTFFYSKKFGGCGSIWNHRTKMFFHVFSFPPPKRNLTLQTNKSPWENPAFWWDLAQKDERFSMVLCFFRVLGRSESCLFLLGTKNWSPTQTPHRNVLQETNLRHLGSTWRPMGAAALRIVESKQVTERRLTLSPRNGSVKNWVYLQKVVVSNTIWASLSLVPFFDKKRWMNPRVTLWISGTAKPCKNLRVISRKQQQIDRLTLCPEAFLSWQRWEFFVSEFFSGFIFIRCLCPEWRTISLSVEPFCQTLPFLCFVTQFNWAIEGGPKKTSLPPRQKNIHGHIRFDSFSLFELPKPRVLFFCIQKEGRSYRPVHVGNINS